MATLTFTRTHPLINAAEMASKIRVDVGLPSDPMVEVDPAEVHVTHANLSEANRPAVQTSIDSYVPDPVYGLVVQPFVFTINGVASLAWTNMPAALTAVPGSETRLPLHNATHARLTTHVRVVGAASAILIAQVSLDGSSYVNGPSVPINTVGLKVSPFVLIPAQYRGDVFFRMAGQGGDSVLDPQFGLTTIQVA